MDFQFDFGALVNFVHPHSFQKSEKELSEFVRAELQFVQTIPSALVKYVHVIEN